MQVAIAPLNQFEIGGFIVQATFAGIGVDIIFPPAAVSLRFRNYFIPEGFSIYISLALKVLAHKFYIIAMSSHRHLGIVYQSIKRMIILVPIRMFSGIDLLDVPGASYVKSDAVRSTI